ncbi:MAG: glycosyltransferase family 4 protein [Paludibacteraceae bacterium]|nr:glycosyltransferase family 4 protein [Paludibacteraceae bacterium]HPH62573.1 glycosyltransferase family 1 protein [Paludibacteraceae bacterium]
MRIGFDAKRAFFNIRGLGNYSRDTIRVLESNVPENEYYLFTPGNKGRAGWLPPESCKIVTPSGFPYSLFPALWRSYGCHKEMESLHLDLYHGLSNEIPYGIKGKVPSVITMHDVIFLKYPEFYPWIDRYTFRKKYTHSCLAADRIIAISEQTKIDLIEWIGADESKIDVVYQGCNPMFHQEVNEEKKQQVRERYMLPSEFMLIVCAIERRKNHEIILEAMHRCKSDLPLVIIGRSSEYKQTLLSLIEKYGLQNRVILLHDVPTADLPAIYRAASLFVYPSHFEGFGIPILEAMTSGLPVITSKGSCFAETGGDAARYVNQEDADELAAVMDEVLMDSALSAQMVEKGYKQSFKFSDEIIAKSFMEVYAKTIKERK